MAALRQCLCGESFAARTNKKWCSPECPVLKQARYANTRRWYNTKKAKPFEPIRRCPCGATFEARRGGRPQKWCGDACPSRLEYLAGRTRKWYDSNRAYARARESMRRSRHKLSGVVRLQELRKKGMNQAVYEAMLTAQKGGCALCSTKTPSKRRPYFDIDHDHTTGQIRGLLCERCNRAIGLMNDDPKTLRRAADYIEKHRASLPLWVVPTPKPRRKHSHA